MSRFKIVVSDKVLVKVNGTTTDEHGNSAPFSLGLVCKRLNDTELRAAQDKLKVVDIFKFLAPLTSGWRDQTLVLEQDGTPAEFSEEAFAELFTLVGMPQLCFNAYVEAVGAQAKN